MKLQEYFLCAKKTKIKTLFNNLFSSTSVVDTCWCRSRHSDVERPSLLIHHLYILVQISRAGQIIASHPLCQNLQMCTKAVLYTACVFHPLLVNKVQCIRVLRQNAGSCAVLISSTKTTTKNIRQRTFFLWLRRDVDELKLISDDKNYDEIYAASSLTRRDGTKMLFEDYRTFKIHP